MHGTIDHLAPICHTTKRRAPPSLFRFLTNLGGLKPCGDLRYILDGKCGWMIRRKGMSLDRAREACVEAGYLQDPALYTGNVTESTINDLLELIAAEARGFKQYPSEYLPERESPYDPDCEEGGESVGAPSPGRCEPAAPRKADAVNAMTAEQYRRALVKLKLSVIGAARPLGISPRQAQRLASGESAVPAPIAKLLRLALAGKITLQDIETA